MPTLVVSRPSGFTVAENVENPAVRNWVQHRYYDIGFNADGSFIGKKAFKKRLLQEAPVVFANTNDSWCIGLYANQIIRNTRLTGCNGRTKQLDGAGMPTESPGRYDARYDGQTRNPSYEQRSESFPVSSRCLEKQGLVLTPQPKAADVFNCQKLNEALPTLDEPFPGEYESEKGTPLPAYGSIAHQHQDFASPPYHYQYGMPMAPPPPRPPPHDATAYHLMPSAYGPDPAYGGLTPNYNSLYPTYGMSIAYTQPPVYGSNVVYGYNPFYTQPVYPQHYSPTYIPAPHGSPPSYGFTTHHRPAISNNSNSSAPAAKPYHEYGDCGETLPLPTMVNATGVLGGGEIRSLAVFTSVFRNMQFISKDGPIAGIKLKDPCLNCKALMQSIPSGIAILAGTGSGQTLDWTLEKKVASEDEQLLREPTAMTVVSAVSGGAPVGYNLVLSAAYSATKPEIYNILEAWTVRNTNSFLSASQKATLSTLWTEFVVPFRDRNQIFRLDNGDNVEPSMQMLNDTPLPICTIFCALSHILSVVLRPEHTPSQRDTFYIPLIAVLGRWCCTLCPWAHPNVINVAYSSTQLLGVDTDFVIGTSKPSVQAGFPSEVVKSKHQGQMRTWRRIFLEERFGRLQNPCPVKVAGMAQGMGGGNRGAEAAGGAAAGGGVGGGFI